MKLVFKKVLYLFSLVMSVILLYSCSNTSTNNYYLLTGTTATNVELSTINDLKIDLEKVVEGTVSILSETEQLPENGNFFILGTIESNSLLKKLADQKDINLSNKIPGSRGGIWAKTTLSNGENAIVIGGSDVQGLQYAIYDYSKEVLGIDPLEYWTNKLPTKKTTQDVYHFDAKTIAPPKVPILAYFENDVDELANYRGKLLEYDWESYTEMINSLVRLRYNAIQFFDMLGRPEFFIRPEYKALKPDYQIDIDYLDKMLDYAHEKGMKIAVDFALGYQIEPMDAEKADCWKTYKADWIQGWRNYFEDTPLSKTDIFILRPRHQVWDWKYESNCGEGKIEVFTEVFTEFGKLVDEYKPNSQKVLVCYSDGMEMWNEGFRPPEDWTVLWSDHGFGEFAHLPNTTDKYEFGTYMHAGYWKNHTVHDPYPSKVETVMKEMFTKYDADKFCLVNGQNFRPFLLNLEAYSEVCNNPDAFNGDDFYKTWTERYFSTEVSEHAISSMKWLHKAQGNRIGYVEHLWQIRATIAYLSNSTIIRPGKTPVSYSLERVEKYLESTELTEKYLKEALTEAEKGLAKVNSEDNFYHSYIYLPSLIFSDLIAFERTLHKMTILKREFESTKDSKHLNEAKKLVPLAVKQLETVYNRRTVGDLDEKWKNWYSVKIRRQNNGFPTMEMLDDIKNNLNNLH